MIVGKGASFVKSTEKQRPGEKELLRRLEKWSKDTAPVYRTRPLTEKEILENTFARLDASEVRAVILRGSYAKGRQNPYSDVDLVVLTDRGAGTIDAFRDAEGTRYHLHIFGRQDSEGEPADGKCRFFYGMRPIYDPEGAGKRLTERLDAAERAVCAKIPRESAEYRAYFLRLVELLRLADADTAFFTRVKILCEFPAFLSAYNGYNLIGFKNTIDCLLRDARPLAMLYAEALRPGSGSAEIEALTSRAFSGPCGLHVLNTDFSHCEKAFDIQVGGETMYQLYGRCTRFMEALQLLHPAGTELFDFYLQCRQKTPTLFRRLQSIAVPS